MPRAIRALAAACSVALLAALVSCSVPWLKAEQDESPQALQAAWKRHLDALKHHPAILRLYTFDTVTAEAPAAPSLAGEAEPLKYVAREPLALVEGRWPGQQAVRLDRGFFEGKPFAVDDKSFTVEMWFRKHGHGAELGNGRTSGMLFAQGDGYWSGVRVWTSYPSRELIFELGRPKPSHSFGTTARDPVPDGVWHHLAATWDGKEMRLYLNGLLLHRAEYAGAYAKPEAPFRIGFADAGVGSLKMDVDEVAVFRRALPAEEVLRHAHFQAELPPATAQRFAAATTAMARRDWPAAERALAPIVGSRRAPARYRAVARLALGRALQKQNKVHEAVAEYAAVFDATAAPASLREIAVRLCVPSDRGAASAQASPRVYRRLLELPELTEAQRLAVRLSLAEQYMQTGKAARAREQYEAALRSPALAAREAWDVRLQIAHTFLRAGDAKAARAAYEELAANTEAPSALRSHALLAAAQTHVRQKAYAKAAGVFARVAAFDEAPRHHRQEAKERIEEMKRIQKGLPARDPTASRTKLALFPSPAVTLHVAPTGHDDNPGTKDKPFASLARARDAVRALRAAKSLPKGGVAVLVRGGQYAARSTLELAEQDSGTADAPIVYRAFPGETPRFTGGVQLEGFAPVTDPTVLARLPEEARGKVAQLDLKAKGIADYGSLGLRGFGLSGYPAHPWADLYVDGKPMQLARWPNEGFVKTGAVHGGTFRGKDSGQPGEFEYAGDRPLRWRQAKDVWLFGYWAHLWAGRSVKVARIDTAKHRIATAHRSSYGYRAGMPYYCLNLLEEIDRPGEWYLDRDTGVLYLYPPVAGKAVVAHFPVLSAPFVRMQDVSHVCLRGLVFEQGRAEGAVVIGGERVLLAGCVFRQLGTNGVVVSGGRGHGLLGCNIHTVGAGGVRMAGGHRGSLRRGDHFVANCHIHDFTRIDRVYAPAVHLDGVGNRIAHNLFHDSPHHALRVEGYEHAIEFNEIHSVVYESDDQAGIDMFGNPAYRGNVLRYNFWHHIGSGHNVAGQSGIRLDDYISAVLVYGNVFYRSAAGRFGGIQIHGGKDNIADNNLFIDCTVAFSFSPWGQKRWLERLARENTQTAIARDGVDITKPPHSTRYPDLARLADTPDRNFIWRNVAVDCGRFSIRERGMNEMMDNHMFRGDPGFADAAARDFTLSDDSPLYERLGFRPIPFREIGLYRDGLRASWPVEHHITPHYMSQVPSPH